MNKLRLLDLFSGIGGFSLGLERTGGFETVAFCEYAEFPRKVLAKHWPNVPIYPDVRELTAERLNADGLGRIDIICGGFPCQDISYAGFGLGLEGERSGLWSEIARLAREIGPRIVFVENVSALLDRGMGDILRDLASLGYDAEWHCIPAHFVGLPHNRDRVWIVAYRDCQGLERGALSGSPREVWKRAAQQLGTMAEALARVSAPSGSSGGIAYGVPNRVDRLKALGNAVVPQIPELIGRAILKSMEDA